MAFDAKHGHGGHGAALPLSPSPTYPKVCSWTPPSLWTTCHRPWLAHTPSPPFFTSGTRSQDLARSLPPLDHVRQPSGRRRCPAALPTSQTTSPSHWRTPAPQPQPIGFEAFSRAPRGRTKPLPSLLTHNRPPPFFLYPKRAAARTDTPPPPGAANSHPVLSPPLSCAMSTVDRHPHE